jgi:ribosomal protein L40E
LILMVTNACLLARIHGKIFAEFGDERLRLVLSASLSPLAAIRSLDLAQKMALDGFHPLAVAAALPGFQGWETLAADQWRRLRYSVASENSAGGIPVDAPGSVEVRAAIEVLARQRGVDPALWDIAPRAEDPAHTQYCPRCRTQFTRQATLCRDCHWTALLPICR